MTAPSRDESRAREIVAFHHFSSDGSGDGNPVPQFEVHIGGSAFSKGTDHDEMAHVYRETVKAIAQALAAAHSEERARCAAVRIEFIGTARELRGGRTVFVVDEEQTQARHAQNLRAT